MIKVVLFSIVLFSTIASAATVTGYVHDAYGRPMAETTVSIDGYDLSATCSTKDGSFTLTDVPAGTVTLLVLYHDSEVQSVDIDVSASGNNYTPVDLPIVCENGSCRIVR